ncbi:ATP-binding protein [Desulfonatronum thioautotrophicum]|uniref:ATP-binding protein n=1 Tax=Desulfonatronum thioautotrophicum TaxID=617001 RepID=UPI0005EBA773|nr:ATP-binding protein [Desulfonatronum thioautotrophicum]
MKQLFKKIITDFQESKIKPTVPRDMEIPLESGKVVSLVGVRRSGKTSLLYQIIESLQEQVDPTSIVYVNFEDDRLFPLELPHLDALVEAYYEIYPYNRDHKVWLFLDEIQNVPNWELFVRRIYDTMNLEIFITGSSSKLLGADLSTALRGRTITYEVFPFSFKEYLRARGIEIAPHSSRSSSFAANAFEDYILHGGFAETIAATSDVRTRTLSDYADLIIYKDIVERHGIKNLALMKHLVKYCLTNMATSASMNRLFNDFKSQGFKVGKDTLFEYFSYLSDAYAVFSVPVFRNSVREEQRNPKKIYAVDNGFKSIFDASLSPDYGRLYENATFLHLRRHTREVYYFLQQQEVDFYCRIQGRRVIANVCLDLHAPDTRKRELNGLAEALAYFDSDQGWLLTRSHEETVIHDGRTITILPLWKWLVEGEV